MNTVKTTRLILVLIGLAAALSQGHGSRNGGKARRGGEGPRQAELTRNDAAPVAGFVRATGTARLPYFSVIVATSMTLVVSRFGL